MESSENKIYPEKIRDNLSPQKNLIEANTKSDSKIKKVAFISSGSFLVSGIVGAIIILVIFGAFPCSVSKCNPNAKCTNQPFQAVCECNYGYNGNGIDCDECGVTYFENNAVPTGINATPHSWPATVDILFSYRTSLYLPNEEYLALTSSNCAGTLINRMAVLTTASCIKTNFPFFVNNRTYQVNVTFNDFHPDYDSMYTVYVGTEVQINFNGINIYPARHVLIDDVFIHDDYDPGTKENDIAIIKFKQKIDLDKNAQLTCLPSKQDASETYPAIYQNAWAAGWGSSGIGYRQVGSLLKNIRLNIYNMSMCSGILKVSNDQLGKYAFCAGEYNIVTGNGKTGTCHGDFGGSLYIKNQINGKDKYITAGLLSYNDGCTTAHSPGIYMNLVHYLDWINANSRY